MENRALMDTIAEYEERLESYVQLLNSRDSTIADYMKGATTIISDDDSMDRVAQFL